jgi:phosphatidyl-myo-inositol alpha-mannosyltransferase
MKVGIVCPYDLSAPGGVQQLTTELAESLRIGGHEVVLVGAGRFAHPRPGNDESTVQSGRGFTIRANQSRVPLTLSPLSWGRVRGALRDADVVHIHEPLIPLVGWVAMTVRRPKVYTFHADPPRWARRVYRFIPGLGRLFRRGVVTAVSRTAASAIPSSWGNVELVPNAIDVGAFDLPVTRVDQRVVFLGRDDPRKGLDILLSAWPTIRSRVDQAELKVMGALREQPVAGVEFLGRVTGGEKNRLLASSQVYVAPNTGGESFGIVIAEAMAAGCAVVCSDLMAFRDVVGEAGELVPVGDPDALAKSVSGLLEDPERARRLGDRARREVERFDWGVITGRYQLMYRRAIGSVADTG